MKLSGVDRALQTIEVLARYGATGAPLKDLAAELDIDKAVLHRTLATLKGRNFAHQDAETNNYCLGGALLAIADDFLTQDTLRYILHRASVRIAHSLNELCHVGVPEGSMVRYIDKIEPDRSVRVWSRIGVRNPLSTTALGRALLAAEVHSAKELEERLLLPAASTDRRATTTLWKHIRDAQRRGFAEETGDNEPGICCVSVAIVRAGIAQAALSVTAESERMDAERRQEIGEFIRAVLDEVLPEGFTTPRIETAA